MLNQPTFFDIVITESVTCFPEDKQRTVNEYARVTRTGGYIGLAESTWLKIPPPPELITWVSQDVGACVQSLTAVEWMDLFENAGLSEIIQKTYPVNAKQEAKLLLRRYRIGGMIAVILCTMRLYFRNPAYRDFVKRVNQGGILPDNITEYFGYGMYVGRKN